MSPLELVAHCNLHDARGALNAGEVGEVARRLIQIWIQRNSESATAGIERPHLLRIGHVKCFPPELQFVSLGDPGRKSAEMERLTQPHVKNDISGNSKDVAFAGFTRVSVAEVLERKIRVASE